jgi:hypothetical protein
MRQEYTRLADAIKDAEATTDTGRINGARTDMSTWREGKISALGIAPADTQLFDTLLAMSTARHYFVTQAGPAKIQFSGPGNKYKEGLQIYRKLATLVQPAIYTLVQREQLTERYVEDLDRLYDYLRAATDAVYRGEGATAFVARNAVADLPALLENRTQLRLQASDREFERIRYTLQAVYLLANRIGHYTNSTMPDGLQEAINLLVDIAPGTTEARVKKGLKEEFRNSSFRSVTLANLGAAATAAQAQLTQMATQAEEQRRELDAALEVAYVTLGSVSNQLSTTPSLPSPNAKDTSQLLIAVRGRIDNFERTVGISRDNLAMVIGLLGRVADALGIMDGTTPTADIVKNVSGIEAPQHTNMDDKMPTITLAAMLSWMAALAVNPGFTEFGSLRRVVANACAAITQIGTSRLQAFAEGRQRVKTLVEESESLAKAVVQKATALFAHSGITSLSGNDAAQQVEWMMENVVHSDFEVMAERVRTAWNQVQRVSAVMYQQGLRKHALMTEFPSGWSSDLATFYGVTKQDVIEQAKKDLAQNVKNVVESMTLAKGEYAKVEALAKDVERLARGFDASKVEAELVAAQNSVRQELLAANAELSAIGAPTIELYAAVAEGAAAAPAGGEVVMGDAPAGGAAAAAAAAAAAPRPMIMPTVDQLMTAKSTLETTLKNRRQQLIAAKELQRQLDAKTKELTQLAKSYDTLKADQEQLAAWQGVLDSYRSAANTFTVAAIAYVRGRTTLLINALTVTYNSMQDNLGNCNTQTEGATSLLKSNVASGSVTPFSSLPDRHPASTLAQILAMLRTALTAPGLDAAGAVDIMRSLLLQEPPAMLLETYPHLFNLRLAVLGSLFVPAVLRSAVNDDLFYQSTSDTCLTVCVARQLEVLARTQERPLPRMLRNPIMSALSGVNEQLAASLKGTADAMFNHAALDKSGTLDTVTLSNSEVANNVFGNGPIGDGGNPAGVPLFDLVAAAAAARAVADRAARAAADEAAAAAAAEAARRGAPRIPRNRDAVAAEEAEAAAEAAARAAAAAAPPVVAAAPMEAMYRDDAF